MAERESVVDFTVPYYDLGMTIFTLASIARCIADNIAFLIFIRFKVGISILMKKPHVPTSLFKFLTVLENDVWMCILGAYFFTRLILWPFLTVHMRGVY